ncbi:uncharacterized protein B0H18DRAFT_1120243 [Fomitopsis serialis]|uniref:uncharacterized protein n=1 Tax=Fomitopsis serialis TaxID=139415 RepID=UPI00200842B9|nr:uncharacterized protein B0H18DRAFT_1120243 [Neoantrodia serialis]KAH9923903.1 hypothetical protein B0H18DRAFT_1120243 [Neoantrodia serialis]
MSDYVPNFVLAEVPSWSATDNLLNDEDVMGLQEDRSPVPSTGRARQRTPGREADVGARQLSTERNASPSGVTPSQSTEVSQPDQATDNPASEAEALGGIEEMLNTSLGSERPHPPPSTGPVRTPATAPVTRARSASSLTPSSSTETTSKPKRGRQSQPVAMLDIEANKKRELLPLPAETTAKAALPILNANTLRVNDKVDALRALVEGEKQQLQQTVLRMTDTLGNVEEGVLARFLEKIADETSRAVRNTVESRLENVTKQIAETQGAITALRGSHNAMAHSVTNRLGRLDRAVAQGADDLSKLTDQHWTLVDANSTVQDTLQELRQNYYLENPNPYAPPIEEQQTDDDGPEDVIHVATLGALPSDTPMNAQSDRVASQPAAVANTAYEVAFPPTYAQATHAHGTPVAFGRAPAATGAPTGPPPLAGPRENTGRRERTHGARDMPTPASKRPRVGSAPVMPRRGDGGSQGGGQAAATGSGRGHVATGSGRGHAQNGEPNGRVPGALLQGRTRIIFGPMMWTPERAQEQFLAATKMARDRVRLRDKSIAKVTVHTTNPQLVCVSFKSHGEASLFMDCWTLSADQCPYPNVTAKWQNM